MGKLNDIIIVGAGPAGIATGVLFKKLGIDNFIILEKQDVGETFRKWPKEMRLNSPSFDSNTFNFSDLNGVTPDITPSQFLKVEHPFGYEYVKYLEHVAEEYKLPIKNKVNVKKIIPKKKNFIIKSSKGKFTAKYVVWAAGEYQYPNLKPFKGARHCIHNSEIRTFKSLKGKEFMVIGAFESGIDSAIALSKYGRKCILIDSTVSLDMSNEHGMSVTVFTRNNLLNEMKKGNITLLTNTIIKKAKKRWSGYEVIKADGKSIKIKTRPILATGFDSSLKLVKDMFEFLEDGSLFLNSDDESTKYPGLFYAGPKVHFKGFRLHGIHKFRQRIPIVAESIAKKMNLSLKPLDEYKMKGMYLR